MSDKFKEIICKKCGSKILAIGCCERSLLSVQKAELKKKLLEKTYHSEDTLTTVLGEKIIIIFMKDFDEIMG